MTTPFDPLPTDFASAHAMILAQRAYESNSKVIHVADDMYSQINGLIR